MKTIIVPTDFSPAAEHALQYAIFLAKQIGAGITPIHSYSLPYTAESFTSSLREIMQRNAEENMRDWVASKVPSHVPCQSKVSPYTLQDELHQLCKGQKDVWIVMGTKGAHDWVDQQIGTTASKVINTLDAPVFIVPEDTAIAFPITAALFATDGKPLNERTKEQWKEVQRVLNIHPIPVQISSPHAEQKSMAEPSEIETVWNDDVSKGIAEAQEHLGAQLTVAVHHKRGLLASLFHNSTTKKLAKDLRQPLLVLQD